MNNKKGFTLAELLIVVAIIAVLTAVAVPIFNTQLEKSREETDIANMRAAKAAAVAYFLDHPDDTSTMKFDAGKGILVASTETVTGYGKGTGTPGGCDSFDMGGGTPYSDTTRTVDGYIQVSKNATDGSVVLSWAGVSNP